MTIHNFASFEAETAQTNATSKLVKAWESKNAKRALKASGVSLMALSLAACSDEEVAAVVGPVTPVVEPVVTPVGQTYVLTTGVDIIEGGAGDDTFIGVVAGDDNDYDVTTINVFDQISGGDGYDTLVIYQTEEFDDVQVLSGAGIEELRYQNSEDEDEIILVGMTDLQKITLFQSDETGNDFENVQNTVDVRFENNFGNTDAFIEVEESAAVADTEVAVELSNNGDNTITLSMETVNDDDFVTAYTINVTGNNEDGFFDLRDTETLTTVTVTGDSSEFEIGIEDTDVLATIDASEFTGDLTLNGFGAQVDLSITSSSGDDSINVVNAAGTTTVAASLSVDAGDGDNIISLGSDEGLQTLSAISGMGDDEINVFANFATTDGSTASIMSGGGDDTVGYFSDENVQLTANLGEGDDLFEIFGVINEGDSVDGGAGIDTFGMFGEDYLAASDDDLAQITNFEALIFDELDTGTYDVSLIDGVNGDVTLNEGVNNGQTAKLIGLDAGANVTIQGPLYAFGNNGTLELVMDADTSDDTLNLTLNSNFWNWTGDEAKPRTITVVASDVENLNVVSTATDTFEGEAPETPDFVINTLVLTDTALKAVTITGDQQLVLDAAGMTVLTTVNAGDFDAGLTIDVSDSTKATTITVGDGDNTITGSATMVNTITTGAGFDTILAGAGNDVISTGNGGSEITAGAGQDTITLGSGTEDEDIDTIFFTSVEDSQGVTVDVINGFQVNDVLDFSMDFGGSLPEDSDDMYVGEAEGYGAVLTALTGLGEASAVLDSLNSTLYVDVNGDGVLDNNDMVIQLTGVTSLDGADNFLWTDTYVAI